jgi:hypothetical protein
LCGLANLFFCQEQDGRAEKLLSSGRKILQGVEDADTVKSVQEIFADTPKHVHYLRYVAIWTGS